MRNDNNEIINEILKDKEFKVLPNEYRIENKKVSTKLLSSFS